MTYKIIQCATGYAGTHALKYILNNPNLQLVGLKCYSEAKAGMDAGAIAGMTATGVKATQDIAALLSLDADCVVYVPQDMDIADPTTEGSSTQRAFKEILTFLESGKNVVTSICGLIAPQFIGPEGIKCVEEINRSCEKGNSTFFATGIDPGFISDVLALTIASTCAEVHSIRGYEIIDYSTYDKLEPLHALGLCVKPEALAGRSPKGLLPPFRSVPHLVGQGIGVAIDDINVTADFRLATETFRTPVGLTVNKGEIAAIRFAVEGMLDGQPIIADEHVTRMRPDIAPEWASIPPNGGYRVEITGSNPVRADFHLGLPGGNGSAFADCMSMTMARVVNSIDFVCEASPGYKTFFDLPMITGRHSFRKVKLKT